MYFCSKDLDGPVSAVRVSISVSPGVLRCRGRKCQELQPIWGSRRNGRQSDLSADRARRRDRLGLRRQQHGGGERDTRADQPGPPRPGAGRGRRGGGPLGAGKTRGLDQALGHAGVPRVSRGRQEVQIPQAPSAHAIQHDAGAIPGEMGPGGGLPDGGAELRGRALAPCQADGTGPAARAAQIGRNRPPAAQPASRRKARGQAATSALRASDLMRSTSESPLLADGRQRNSVFGPTRNWSAGKPDELVENDPTRTLAAMSTPDATGGLVAELDRPQQSPLPNSVFRDNRLFAPRCLAEVEAPVQADFDCVDLLTNIQRNGGVN